MRFFLFLCISLSRVFLSLSRVPFSLACGQDSDEWDEKRPNNNHNHDHHHHDQDSEEWDEKSQNPNLLWNNEVMASVSDILQVT